MGKRGIEMYFDNKKAPISGSFLNLNGGGGGIRTLVTLYRPNGFRDRRIQPLCHPSAWGKNKAGSKACFGINWRRVRDLNPGDAFDAYTISNRAPSASSDNSPNVLLDVLYIIKIKIASKNILCYNIFIKNIGGTL